VSMCSSDYHARLIISRRPVTTVETVSSVTPQSLCWRCAGGRSWQHTSVSWCASFAPKTKRRRVGCSPILSWWCSERTIFTINTNGSVGVPSSCGVRDGMRPYHHHHPHHHHHHHHHHRPLHPVCYNHARCRCHGVRCTPCRTRRCSV